HHHHHHHHHGHGHHADEVFDEFGVETAHKYTEDGLKAILEAFDDFKTYGYILRAKGIVEGENGEWYHFDFVPDEPEVRTGSAETTGMIAVIGVGLKKDHLKELFGLE
ncbi:MAG: GTP-binding protein, partial [Mogibacterium sp.]|nr:GTP-binding protein [Mogibacterium sp.]